MGKSCAVIECTPEPSVSLYKVPEQGKTKPSWLKFLRTVNSEWMWQPTQNMFVCVHHFTKNYVLSGAAGKTRISTDGFPTLNNKEIVPEMKNEEALYLVPPDTTRKISASERILELEAILLEKDHVIHKLEAKLNNAKSELKICRESLRAANKRLDRMENATKRKLENNDQQQAKLARIDDDELMLTLERKINSPVLLAIIRRDIIGKTPYCDLLKEFSFRLHYYSGKGYEVLRNGLNNIIPSVRSLIRWTDHVKVKPGFLKESLDFLTKSNSEATGQVYYALSVDEIHIRKQIIHKDDGFVGYVDYGGIQDVEPEKRSKVASAALFVLATCINGRHKIPICYILTSGLKANVLAAVLKASLINMRTTNSIVVSITFDGLPSNFKAMEQIGANMKINDNEFQPCLIHQDSLLKVHLVPDVCHMMKLLRNLFKKFGVIKNFKGQNIKWIHVHRLQKLQDQEGLKAANKLGHRHVNFELEKMKTKLCLQVMSNSVAVAIRLCRILNVTGFGDSDGTEEFLILMNRLFDIMNSKCGGKGFRSPLCKSKMADTLPFLAMMKFYLLSLCVNQGGKWINLVDSSKGTAVKGLVCAITSAENLLKDYVLEECHYLQYLPMYKLSQDKIELFFSTIRSRLGRNDNPNCIQLAHCVKKILCMKARSIVQGNCVEQEDDEGYAVCAFKNINAILDESEDPYFEEDPIDVEESLPDLSAFSGNIVCYISGYVGQKLCPSLACKTCIYNIFPDGDDVDKLKNDSILLMEKDTGGLFLPSYFLLSVCKLAEQFTRRHESKGLHNISKNELISSVVAAFAVNFKHLWRCTEDYMECGHFESIIRTISADYVKLRLHHSARQSTLETNPSSKRNFNTRLYILDGV